MRLGPSRGRSRWLLGGAVLVPAVIGVVLTVGLPGENGCGGLPSTAHGDSSPGCDAKVTSAALVDAQTQGRIVFLNRAGQTLKAGADDAAQSQSSVLSQRGLTELTVPAAPFNEAEWRSVVSCIKQRFARFDVDFVTERPPQPGYLMAVFGGTGADLGFASNIGGTAPIDNACATLEHAVAFIFSGRLGADPQLHCEVAAQEIAHAFSVDHSFVAADAMSYLPSSTPKTFQDVDAECGEFQSRPCVCGRRTQNSYRLLLERLGPSSRRPDQVAPSLAVRVERSRRDSVVVTVEATDNRAVERVRLSVRDGAGELRVSTCGDAVFPCVSGADTSTFTVGGMPEGATFQVTAVDAAGNSSTTFAAVAAPPAQVVIGLEARSSRRALEASVRPQPGSRVIKQATLLWTQLDGSVTRLPLCARAGGGWSAPIEVAAGGGNRQMAIELIDDAGQTHTSTPEEVSFQP